MSDRFAREVAEAEDLLRQVQSWSEEEVEQLPLFYRRKARRYRELMQLGEE